MDKNSKKNDVNVSIFSNFYLNLYKLKFIIKSLLILFSCLDFNKITRKLILTIYQILITMFLKILTNQIILFCGLKIILMMIR